MNYDETNIAAGYDQGRDHGPEFLNLWMTTLAAHVKDQRPSTILDLGCGTGRFSQALAMHFAARVVGVDPSQKMLDRATRKAHGTTVRYAIGSGEAIPLLDESVGMIFMSMVFHHFTDPLRVAQECHRVLRDAGLAAVRAGTLDRVSHYPYVPFFPASVRLLMSRLSAAASIRDVFETAGFQTVAFELIVQQVAPTHRDYADKLAAGADSILASLSKDALDAGLRALREHARRVDPKAVTEPIDFFVFRREAS